MQRSLNGEARVDCQAWAVLVWIARLLIVLFWCELIQEVIPVVVLQVALTLGLY